MKVISYLKKYYLEILSVFGLLLVVYCTYWIYTPSYWQYTKPVTKEFICLRKNYSPSSYRREEEFHFLCSNNGELYYIEVSPTTYYNIDKGKTVSFTMSEKNLRLYSDRDRNDNIALLFFLIMVSLVPCIIAFVADNVSKLSLGLTLIISAYLLISMIVYFILNVR